MDSMSPVKKPRLPPGFRFRPTDEELVVHYLRRRALECPLPAAVDIPDIRILAHDPSDLLPPGWSEPERYFFTCKEAKYVKGRRANRATGAGYWKATGKEKPVAVSVPGAQGQAVVVGMKRSLVFYRGKPPSGSKTDWVLHEYRLAGAGLAPCRRRGLAGGAQHAASSEEPSSRPPAEGWVLCRVFRKKGSSSSCSTAAAPKEEEEQEYDAGGEAAEQTEEEDAVASGSSTGFIDFFARAEEQRTQEQQPPRHASSSSCLTDASLEQQQQQCREQETTSRGA